MSRKFSAARKGAFLKALTETGNQTIAAERAKVSRSWVQLHRSTDPAFDADCRAAIADAKSALSGAEGRAPPSGWGHLDGEELVVKGTNGRRVQIARARLKQWTPRIEDRFLAVLAATCNVKAACAEVGLTQASAYLHRRRWPAFAARWDEAIEIGCLELEAALLEAGANLFSAADAPLTGTSSLSITGMDAHQALHLLHMHKHYLPRPGRLPGRAPTRATEAETVAAIERELARYERRRERAGEQERRKAED